MAISPTSKALLGLLGVGAAGGTAWGGYKVFNKDKETLVKSKKTIAQLIGGLEDKVLLTKKDQSNEAAWKASWKLYRENNKSLQKGADPWTLSDFAGNYASSTISEDVAPDSFVNKCSSLSSEEVENEKDNRYIQVFTWCTKSK
ncbi:hypothetical protein MHF_1342 [Mycoplasma haemofelis Ohio2]|uniref:Uncharacterized protein n=1 Tax=Mycoplasma haemofelis (strain Ohio2) TaxID=859194 RepID=F6FG80_MYCHI|nr:hypothetical protein MHF_1342 [Mycoplasma haemofelis Ohio2]